MIEYKSGERLGFIKKAHTRKSVLVQYGKVMIDGKHYRNYECTENIPHI